MNIETEKLSHKKPEGSRRGMLKYENKFKVSYPTKMYVLIREQAMKESLSIQDLQRKAMDYYLTFSANKK